MSTFSWDLFDFPWDVVVLSYVAGVFQPSGVPGESQLVLTDGWDGWMGWDGMGWDGMGWDGLVRTCFCSAYCTKTTRYMMLILSMPPRSLYKTSFVKKSNFFKKYFIFKKFRTKRVFFFCPGNRPFFSAIFFTIFWEKNHVFW